MRLPSSFLPEEDQGYLFVQATLPEAASLQRTDAVCGEVEKVLLETPGVAHVTTVVGFSLLSGTQMTYSGFFFVTLKPWGERKDAARQLAAIRARIGAEAGKIPGALVFPFPPPAIPGVGSSGGITFILEDRSGSDVAFLARNTRRFLEAARRRPEVTGLSTTFIPDVPQVFARVDRDRALRQGVDLGDVYLTLQSFMGGSFVNYFNRFGRQWQVYLEAEGEYRSSADNVGQFYVRNKSNQAVPLSSLCDIEPTSGPEFTLH
jgi:HAE1 family hydrophobic/amphiphilic exporter-1